MYVGKGKGGAKRWVDEPRWGELWAMSEWMMRYVGRDRPTVPWMSLCLPIGVTQVSSKQGLRKETIYAVPWYLEGCCCNSTASQHRFQRAKVEVMIKMLGRGGNDVFSRRSLTSPGLSGLIRLCSSNDVDLQRYIRIVPPRSPPPGDVATARGRGGVASTPRCQSSVPNPVPPTTESGVSSGGGSTWGNLTLHRLTLMTDPRGTRTITTLHPSRPCSDV